MHDFSRTNKNINLKFCTDVYYDCKRGIQVCWSFLSETFFSDFYSPILLYKKYTKFTTTKLFQNGFRLLLLNTLNLLLHTFFFPFYFSNILQSVDKMALACSHTCARSVKHFSHTHTHTEQRRKSPIAGITRRDVICLIASEC